MTRKAYVDYQALAAQFTVGEFVRKIDAVRGKEFANFLEGRVEAVLTGIGFVDVAFPWGTDRMSPDLLVRVEGNPAVSGDFLDSYDRNKGGKPHERVAVAHARQAGPLYETALRMREAGVSEMDAYSKIYDRYASTLGDGVVTEAVSFAYEASTKVALYWKEKGRRYCPSREERDTGVLNCPRCKAQMGRTVYKKHVKLYACPSCLFLIKPGDLIDPAAPGAESPDEATERDFESPHNAFNDWL